MFFSKVNIEIAGKYKITHVNEVTFIQSDKELLSTCQIKLPFIKNVEAKIKRGDRVRVDFSMSIDFNQDDFKTEFTGFVKKVVLGLPLVIEVENNAYLLKQRSISRFYRGVALKALLEKVLVGFDFETVYSDSIRRVTLDKFLVKSGASVYDVLKKLMDKFKLIAYFKSDKLYLGSRYLIEKIPPVVVYDLERNVSKDSIVLKSEDDIRIRVKATSRLRTGQELKVEVGDSGGSIRTFFYHNIKTESELRELALAELEEAKNKKRNAGSIQVFGLPYVEHSYHVKIVSTREINKQKNGVYHVEKTGVSFSVNEGFKRVIHLGKNIS